MLKIKLSRVGKKNQPHYRIVVNEARSKRDGKHVALLGNYAPAQEPKTLQIDMEAYKKWIGEGAQPTDTVAALAKRFESGNPFPAKKKLPSKKAQEKAAVAKEAKEAPAVEAAPAEAPAEEAAATEEAPAAEAQKDEAPADTAETADKTE